MAAKRKSKKRKPAIDELIEVMARLRGPGGCPWDREQDHKSIRFHAVDRVQGPQCSQPLGHAFVFGELFLQHCIRIGEATLTE